MERLLWPSSKVRELAACNTLASNIFRARNRHTLCQGQPRSKKRLFLIHPLLPVAPLQLTAAVRLATLPRTRMGTTSSLPEEVLTSKRGRYSYEKRDYPVTSVASYCFQRKEDFFALRAASKSGLALAQRALSNGCVRDARCANFPYGEGWTEYVNHGGPPPEMRASARQVEAVGRVFGAGCIDLSAHGRSPERIAALDAFVRRTNGGLRTLDLQFSCVTAETLLRMCRASPKLTTLRGPRTVHVPDGTIISISAACPDLCDVDFSQVGRIHSPAETWQRHFPGLHDIKLRGSSLPYKPTRIDAIRETALTCRHARCLDIDNCHITADVIEAIAGTPLGDSLEDLDEIENYTVLERDAIIAAVRCFPKLSSLKIPEGSMMPGPGFYVDLGRTTGRWSGITHLHLEDEITTDACIAAACSHLRLGWLEVDGLELLTSRIVDAITRSQSAATLWAFNIAFSAADPPEPGSPLRAEDVLRLLQGCPKLSSMTWSMHEYDHDRAGIDRVRCGAIVDLLKGRNATINRYFFDELDEGIAAENISCIIEAC